MPITGVLILASLLAQSPAQPQQDGSQPNPNHPAHGIGIGAGVGVVGSGGGIGVRGFFNDRLGVNFNMGYAQPSGGNRTNQGGTYFVAPSAVYMLTGSSNSRAVNVRPYVGGGLNYTHTSTPPGAYYSASSATGLGMQAFGGAEVTFQAFSGFAISGEVSHYRMVSSPAASWFGQGTNFYLLFHYYMK